MLRSRARSLLVAGLFAVVGCECASKKVEPQRVAKPAPPEPPPDVGATRFDIPSRGGCARGRWDDGEEESIDMLPGSRCLECHGPEDDVPFAFAGTVYADYNEKDDCYGVEGVTVEIIDRSKRVFEAKTSKTGNFAIPIEDAPQVDFPVTANVIGPDGNIAPKTTLLTIGDCNECHSETGTGRGGARGRIVPHPDTVKSMF